MICYLNLKGARIPGIIQVEIAWVDKCHLLIYENRLSLQAVCHIMCLLGALAARMFYLEREPPYFTKRRAGTDGKGDILESHRFADLVVVGNLSKRVDMTNHD
jgi:hypothetical protein